MMRQLVACCLALVVLVTAACTGDPSPVDAGASAPASKASVAALPASQFAGIAGATDTGASDVVDQVVRNGQDVVALGWVAGSLTRQVIRLSNDAGAHWTVIDLPIEIAELENLGHLAHTSKGWWALGEAEEKFYAATSVDGRQWKLTPLPDLDHDALTVEDVVATDQGLVILASQASDQPDDPSVALTSVDGLKWTPSPTVMPAQLTALAYREGRVVAVGRKDGEGDEAYVPSVWLSIDRGATWAEQRPIPRLANNGKFVTHLTDVEATQAGFVLVGQQFVRQLNGYQPFTLSSDDGAVWTTEKAVVDFDSRQALLVADADELYLQVTLRVEGLAQPQPLIFHRQGSAWVRLTLADDVASGAQAWQLVGVVASKGLTRAFATSPSAQRTAAALWQWSETEVSEAPYPSVPDQPVVVSPVALARTSKGFVAVGHANGLPAIWYAGPDLQFGAAQALSDDPQDEVGGVSVAGDQLVVFGANNGLTHPQGLTWMGAVGSVPKRTPMPTGPDWDQYHLSSVAGAAMVDQRWVVVGRESQNGARNISALVKSWDEKKGWTAGKPATITSQGDEQHYEVSDLSGNEAQHRRITDIAVADRGVVAVGSYSGEDEVTKPARWGQMPDGSWIMHALPLAGLRTAWATSVTTNGKAIVISGWGRPAGATRSLAVFWRSVNGGRDWTTATQEVPGQSWIMEPRSGGSTMVMWGGPDAPRGEAVCWTSTDGLHWALKPQDSFRTDTATQLVRPLDVVVEGDQQWVMVKVDARDASASAVMVVQRPV